MRRVSRSLSKLTFTQLWAESHRLHGGLKATRVLPSQLTRRAIASLGNGEENVIFMVDVMMLYCASEVRLILPLAGWKEAFEYLLRPPMGEGDSIHPRVHLRGRDQMAMSLSEYAPDSSMQLSSGQVFREICRGHSSEAHDSLSCHSRDLV